eukprot:TRINITY_DN2672_c0_g1_i1.p1 TRINITY_DN2672_c0_g1~~TRINITY_DN2672_c0_g1_i1.p1  ORF type:complete len:213 (-),score=59.16 TRINITY_DN2672_c0_g1_i1:29-667(-)
MSHHCHDEHSEHHGHDHSKDVELERGQEYSLYQHIDTTKVICLNEKIKDSSISIFKPWNERLSKEKYLESDVDEELIINIPFTQSIKLKSLIIIGATPEESPKKLKLFTNREDIDFSNASSIKPIQEFDLVSDPKGEYEYPTKISLFNNVNRIILYIPQNFGANTTKICYVGLKGDYSPLARREAVITSYESKPQLSDHKLPNESTVSRNIQ